MIAPNGRCRVDVYLTDGGLTRVRGRPQMAAPGNASIELHGPERDGDDLVVMCAHTR